MGFHFNFFLGLLLIPVAMGHSQTVLLYDGFGEIESLASRSREIYDATEIQRNPVFENVPFLRLRQGDKLVTAKERPQGKDLMSPNKKDEVNYYLFSREKYYRLDNITEKNGKLSLQKNSYIIKYCLLFDWDLTLENARVLRNLLPIIYVNSLTRDQLHAIENNVQKDFPSSVERRYSLDLEEDHIRSIPGQSFAEFHGLTYEGFSNCIYHYIIRIGPSTCTIIGKIRVQGPPNVERDEFEDPGPRNGPNGPGPWHVDPQKAKIKRAEYDRMMSFRKLVNEAIDSKSK
jgi:hypothetical protein